MLKIDNSLLTDIGLGTLPDAEKNSLLKHIYETLEMRVGMRLADQMTNEQLDEFEQYFEAKDDAGAFKWLETNFPNYKDIVQQEFDKLKAEVQGSAPQILATSQQQAATAQQMPQAAPAPQVAPPQPAAPQVDQFAQPVPQQPQPYQPAPDYQAASAPATAQPLAAPDPQAQPTPQPYQPAPVQDIAPPANPQPPAAPPNPGAYYPPAPTDGQPPAGFPPQQAA